MRKVLGIAVATFIWAGFGAVAPAAAAGPGAPSIDKSLDDLLTKTLQTEQKKKRLPPRVKKILKGKAKLVPKKIKVKKWTPAERAAARKKAKDADQELLNLK